MADLGRPLAKERFAVYIVVMGGSGDPVLLNDAETLDGALGWIQANNRDVRRTFGQRAMSYGEVFDWQQGSTVMHWRVS